MPLLRRVLGLACASLALLPAPRPTRAAQGAGTAWEFRFAPLEEGEPEIDLAAWRGSVLLVVNTASFCGFTRQFEEMERLHQTLGGQGLRVLGVPSNDFRQEAEERARIATVCRTDYGVTFPMTAPQAVSGTSAHPFFRWAAAQAGPPRWNFHKYVVGRDGRVRGAVPPQAGMRPVETLVRRALADPAPQAGS
jgi:glutathione peroxidase